MAGRRRLDRRAGPVGAFLGESLVIRGLLEFEGTLRLDGRLEGTVHSSGLLIIGPSAVVDADLYVRACSIAGRVSGRVFATEQVDLLSTAVVYADIQTPSLHLEDGVVFQGSCSLQKPDRPPPAAYRGAGEESSTG